MSAARWLGVIGVSGCVGSPGVTEGVFDSFVFSDTFRPCEGVAMSMPWPASGASGVDPLVAPEVFVSADAPPVTLELYDVHSGVPVDAEPVWRDIDAGRLGQLVPADPLAWNRPWLFDARTADDPSATCVTAVQVGFQTRAPPNAHPEVPAGTWWLGGADPANAGAAVLHRLLPRQDAAAGGYGTALAFTLDGDGVTLRTLQRTTALPAFGCDAPDAGDATWRSPRLTATVPALTLDDPTRPIAVDGPLTVDGYYDPSTDRWFGLRLRGRLDLRGWDAADLAEACATAAGRGLGCTPCGEGAPAACIDLDARGMSADRLDHGLDDPARVCTR